MSNLILKVSETKYMDTIHVLNKKAAELTYDMYVLKSLRQRLEDSFISNVLSGRMIEMIRSKEKEVTMSIESIQKQTNEIRNFLQLMHNAERVIDEKIRAAADTGAEVFR